MAKFLVTKQKEVGINTLPSLRTGQGSFGGGSTGSAQTAQAVVGAGLAIAGIVKGAQKRAEEQAIKKQKIEAQKRKWKDTNSTITGNSIIQSAIDQHAAFRAQNADTSLWAADLEQRLEAARTEADGLDLSPEAREIFSQRLEAKAVGATDDSFIAEAKQEAQDTRESLIDSIVNAYTRGTKEDQQTAGKMFLEQAGSLWDEAEGKKILETAIMAGQKARKEETLNNWQDRIAEDPIASEKILEAELAGRKEDKGTISEGELSSENIQSLLNSATNRKAQILADTQAAVNKANKELETKLHDDIVAGTASITDISKSNLPAEAKRRLERDISDVAERDVANTWAIQDSTEAATSLDSILSQIEGGTIDINEAISAVSKVAREKTPGGRSVVSKKSFDKTMANIEKGGRDAIDTFTSEQTKLVKNSLLSRLDEQQARLQLREQTTTLTPRERRQLSSVGFLNQVNRNQLINY